MNTHVVCPSGQSARRLERVNERLDLDDIVAGCAVQEAAATPARPAVGLRDGRTNGSYSVHNGSTAQR